MKPKKIYILGTSGSGKSFLGKLLSKQLKILHYDLDELIWIKKYTKKRDKEKRKIRLKKIADKEKWIIEGVSCSWIEYAIKKADLIILLDISLKLASFRVLKRWLTTRGEKGNLKDSINLIREVSKYKKGKHSVSYKGHKNLLKKHNLSYIIIKNKKMLKKFLEGVK